MWPLIETKKGDWFPADVESSSMHGLQAYKVFIAVAIILGDGLYNFCKVLSRTLSGLFVQLRGTSSRASLTIEEDPTASPYSPKQSYDDQRRTRFFLKDQIPTWFAVGGYIIIAATSTAILPHIHLHLRAGPSLLQRLRSWTHGLVLSFDVRKASHIHDRSLGGLRARRDAGRSSSLRSHDEHSLHSFRSHARLQNRLPHVIITKINIHKPSDRNSDGMCRVSLRVLEHKLARIKKVKVEFCSDPLSSKREEGTKMRGKCETLYAILWYQLQPWWPHLSGFFTSFN
ncbi:hypothetical protein YC2023_030356 [Brassica napus]